MSFRPSSPTPPGITVALCFALLGLHVGVLAAQTADVVVRLGLSPGELGLSSTAAVAAGILTLLAGGALVDRWGRRTVLIIGFIGAGIAFILVSQIGSFVGFLVSKAALGFFISWVDLGVNAVGSDHERVTGKHSMTAFHSWFSLGAAAGAGLCALGLVGGIGFRPAFAALGAVLMALGVALPRLPLPEFARVPAAATRSESAAMAGAHGQALNAGVLLATALVFLCFFGDGILETFLSTLIRLADDDAVLAAVVVAAFHAASWLGRLVFHLAVNRLGERLVLGVCGPVAALATVSGLLLSGTPAAWGTTACFAVVGFFLSPVVPLGFSRAGRAAAPENAGRAIGFVTTVGYSAFIASPVVAGAIADRAGIGAGVTLAAATMTLVGAVGLIRSRVATRRGPAA